MLLEQPDDMPLAWIFGRWRDEPTDVSAKSRRRREVNAMTTPIKNKVGQEADLHTFAKFQKFILKFGTDKLLFVSSNDYLKKGPR